MGSGGGGVRGFAPIVQKSTWWLNLVKPTQNRLEGDKNGSFEQMQDLFPIMVFYSLAPLATKNFAFWPCQKLQEGGGMPD